MGDGSVSYNSIDIPLEKKKMIYHITLETQEKSQLLAFQQSCKKQYTLLCHRS
jgi:hypothetical protein